ncbi:hypothetical protein DB32_005739 [Sandaracinus amylolyticus]|uniref:Uncharacterized protein n=1 Tax=Sandaracinus amylolyticus TaxID=927083 RepID=A0A0F6W6L7_9BACT|nr:hypothetical protein DB32_005739 [Sandaracinus amylolyticus]
MIAIAPLASGCRVYDPALLDRVDAGGGSACEQRTQPPTRPDVADGDGPEVAFGLRMVVMEQGNDWPAYGYDLDGFCTEQPDLMSECVPPAERNPPVDGAGGVDNVFGFRFFPLVDATTPDLESEAQEAQEKGQGLPIIRLRGWNGEPNDSRVDAAIMQAVFGAPGDASDEPPSVPADPASSRPVWDGRDWFWVRDDAFLMDDLGRPLIRDDNAYVADGVLVVRLPDRVDIIFPADAYGVLVRLTGAQATGRISADGTMLEDVRVAGRWSLNDLLVTARNIGVCEGETEYDLLNSQLDRIADVRSTPGSGGPGVVCDAISLGVGFTGTRVRVAGLAEGPPLADLCATTSDGGTADAGVPDGGT